MWHSSLVSNMNFPAPVSVLGFLAACGGLALSTLAIVVTCFVGKTKFVKPLLALIGAGALVYFGLLLTFSFVSRDRVLAQGQEKYFCEIDCHLAYSVVGVKLTLSGQSMDYTVILRTRFDETTTSPGRPNQIPLTPSPCTVEVIDALGRAHPATATIGNPLTAPLKPGASYLTELHFQLPGDAKAQRLLITSTGWPEHLLIGDERSPLHGKTWFGL